MALMAVTKLLVCVILTVAASGAIGVDGTCKSGDVCDNGAPKQEDVSALFQRKTEQVLTSRVPPIDDPNTASVQPRMKKLMELNATVAALGNAAGTPGFKPIIEDLIHVIETDLQEKVKSDQNSAQSKVTERITELTDATERAVADKAQADELDTALDACVTEEQQLLQAHETCKSQEAVLEIEKPSHEYCGHPAFSIVYTDPPQLDQTVTPDFSQGLTHVQQQLDNYIAPLEKWVDDMKVKAVGDQDDWDAADLRCKQKTQELEDKKTECGNRLGAWRTKRETCLHAKSEQKAALCEFGHSYQAKCAAKIAYDTLQTDITGNGSLYSQPDRMLEWRHTTRLVCILNVMKDNTELATGTVAACTKSDDEAADEFEKDVGAIDLQQTTYDWLMSPANFTCAEANVGFASGVLWTVPENSAGDTEWIPKSSEYTKVPDYKYAIESDSSKAPFDFCLGIIEHPTAPTCGSAFDCTAGSGSPKPAATRCHVVGGCTSADCCADMFAPVYYFSSAWNARCALPITTEAECQSITSNGWLWGGQTDSSQSFHGCLYESSLRKVLFNSNSNADGGSDHQTPICKQPPSTFAYSLSGGYNVPCATPITTEAECQSTLVTGWTWAGTRNWDNRIPGCQLGNYHVYFNTNTNGVAGIDHQTPICKQARYVMNFAAQGWQEAEDACVAAGGHLPSISNQAENDALESLCATAICSDCAGDKNIPYMCWIGGRKPADDLSSGEFVWTDGTPVTFKNYESGGGQAAGVPSQPYLGMWNPSSTHNGKSPGKWQFEPSLKYPSICDMAPALGGGV